MARDTLFLLRPGFTDKGKPWFCPFAAQVQGMLAFFPEIGETLELVEIDFAKPREAVVELLGESHQATPVLVLHPDSPTDVQGVTIGEANGYRFVEKTLEIMTYLAVTRSVPPPHPPK